VPFIALVTRSVRLFAGRAERINTSGSFARFVQRHSHTVYDPGPDHRIRSVALELSLEHRLKFGLAAAIPPLCFAAA